MQRTLRPDGTQGPVLNRSRSIELEPGGDPPTTCHTWSEFGRRSDLRSWRRVPWRGFGDPYGPGCRAPHRASSRVSALRASIPIAVRLPQNAACPRLIPQMDEQRRNPTARLPPRPPHSKRPVPSRTDPSEVSPTPLTRQAVTSTITLSKHTQYLHSLRDHAWVRPAKEKKRIFNMLKMLCGVLPTPGFSQCGRLALRKSAEMTAPKTVDLRLRPLSHGKTGREVGDQNFHDLIPVGRPKRREVDRALELKPAVPQERRRPVARVLLIVARRSVPQPAATRVAPYASNVQCSLARRRSRYRCRWAKPSSNPSDAPQFTVKPTMMSVTVKRFSTR